MKALIVDDEKHVREAIRLLGNWGQNGITEINEAANGEEAIQLIQKHRPEIIFSDMKMPKMDGVMLLEWIKEHQPNSKTIVVTGYDDYHYMRKAIHFGSSDYLLKPVDPDILNHTLEKVVREWKKEKVEREKKVSSSQLINEMKPVYRDRKLTQLLNGDFVDDGLFREFGLQRTGSYQVAIVRVSGKNFEAFEGDRDLTYFTILNVINEVVLKKECGIGFRYLSNKNEAVIIFWDKLDQVGQLLKQIFKLLKKVMDIACPIGLGKLVTQSSPLIDSYNYAREVLITSNILDTREERVFLEQSPNERNLTSLMSYSSDIELAVQAGEVGAFSDVIDKVIKEFKNNHYLSIQQLYQFEKEYQVISNKWAKENSIQIQLTDNMEKQIDIFFDENGTFQLDRYVERKKREISYFLKKLKRLSQRKNSNILEEIEKYLQTNFDRDVKLQEIAEHFYLSREYISRKFKQEFNITISDYILKIRMDKAKSLLKNSHLKIYEIANMIGYQDDKYFRKVFKKFEGITPNEFRAHYIND